MLAYRGRTLRVIVLADGAGFELDGERYRTLTAVAKKITGGHVNGFRWFRQACPPKLGRLSLQACTG